jgi:hypothetical protein
LFIYQVTMTKLDSIPPSLIYPTSSHFDRGPASRLIVLFPAQAGDYPSQSHRIWEIARSFGLNVLLLSLCSDSYEESQLRRQLIMMAAMISDSNICTDIRIEHGNDWVGQVKNIYRHGDLIACYAGQRVGLMQKLLHEVLRSQLEAPIYILSVDQPIKNSKPKLLSQISFWLGALAIIGGFLWLEVKIVQLPQDWALNLLIYLCVFVEVGLLLLWNSIFT